MSALRWDQLHDDPGDAEPPAPSQGPTIDPRMASAEDDDPARGIVLGVAASLIGFWAPLAAVLAIRWAR